MTNELATTLTEDVLQNLDSYEDYLGYYTQLDEAATSVSWVKADLLVHMQNKLGDKSIQALSKDIKQPYTTVVNYIRVARAFPPDRRLSNVAFTHHYQASYADTYDENTKKFTGEARFKWIEKAADEHLSVRGLIEQVHVSKLKAKNKITNLTCNKCNSEGSTTRRYVMYSPGAPKEALRVDLCDECFLKIADYIYGAKAR